MDYYYFPPSYWARVVSLALAEKGIEPRRHFVDIRNNETFAPDYMRLNPKGVVPTLVDGSRVVCDSVNIVQYLDERFAPVLLAPPSAPSALGWVEDLEGVQMMHISYAVWVEGLRGERSAAILDDKIERATRYAREHPDLSERYERKRKFFARFRDEVRSAEHRRRALERARATLGRMTASVERNRWIAGKEFTLADCIALSMLYRLADLRVLASWTHDSNHPLSRYYARLRERASFRKVFDEDPLLEEVPRRPVTI